METSVGGGIAGLFPTAEQIKALPECQLKCTGRFFETIQVALQAPNHAERYRQVCERYTSTAACMQELDDETCKNKEAFYIMTSGLKYMCVEQTVAFNGTIHCIDDYSEVVQKECEIRCNLKGKMFQIAARMGLVEMFLGKRADAASAKDPTFDKELALSFVSDTCKLTKCYLECIRTKYNVHCGGAAGALLTEALVRPFADAQRNQMFGTMMSLLANIMPNQATACGFIVNENGMEKLRIDPKVDADLRRMYSERVANVTDAEGAPSMQLIEGIHHAADVEDETLWNQEEKKSPLDD
ncbi:Protein CPG-4 [Aphelenchoides avenae]|nr:Protein CPG-4 [Aphelenchus avenae]